jgi:hypothetical protein
LRKWYAGIPKWHARTVLNWIENVYRSVTGKIDSTIASWVHALVHGLYQWITAIFGPVGRAWDDLWKTVSAFVAAHDTFAVRVINALKAAYDWINKEGYLVYYYISHPSQLVILIIDPLLAYIEKEAVSVSEKLGTFVLTFITHNLKTVITIVEDIVDAVF